jgi:enoyl-[acyl-carrier protein] reductase II
MNNSITKLFKIEYPIIQGGMIWVSGAKLAAAVSNAGGLGVLGAGSMKPDVLREHILKTQSLTKNPFAVNIPLLYSGVEDQINCALGLGVKIFFTSAGSPKKFTSYLKEKGVTVVHVTSSPALALKCVEAGVDAVVAEGYEAGGHNGREEITTMALIPQVRKNIQIPLIAAGGIATGGAIVAALALGADGVQMGTRFLMTKESSAHENFKNLALTSLPHSTQMAMRATTPVRLLYNQFASEIKKIEETYMGQELKEKLSEHLGKFRAMNGMLKGELEKGELEIGQVVSLIKNIPTVAEVMKELIDDYQKTLSQLPKSLLS